MVKVICRYRRRCCDESGVVLGHLVGSYAFGGRIRMRVGENGGRLPLCGVFFLLGLGMRSFKLLFTSIAKENNAVRARVRTIICGVSGCGHDEGGRYAGDAV